MQRHPVISIVTTCTSRRGRVETLGTVAIWQRLVVAGGGFFSYGSGPRGSGWWHAARDKRSVQLLFDSVTPSRGAPFGLSISDPYNKGPHQRDGSFFVNNISNINLNGNKSLPQTFVNAMRLFWIDKKRLLFTTRLPLMKQVCRLCQFKTYSGSSKRMTYSEKSPPPPRPPVAAFCKCSSGLAGLLQMIFQMGWPFPNDHPDGLAFSKMIIRISSFQPTIFKSEDDGSISWTFLEQCVLVLTMSKCRNYSVSAWNITWPVSSSEKLLHQTFMCDQRLIWTHKGIILGSSIWLKVTQQVHKHTQ